MKYTKPYEHKSKECNIKKLIPKEEHLDREREDAIKSIKLAIANSLISTTEGKKLFAFVKERLDDTLGDSMKAELKPLYDKNALYNEVIKELETFPFADWKQINKRKVDERRAKADDIFDKYRQEINEKVKEILKDVEFKLTEKQILNIIKILKK